MRSCHLEVNAILLQDLPAFLLSRAKNDVFGSQGTMPAFGGNELGTLVMDMMHLPLWAWFVNV